MKAPTAGLVALLLVAICSPAEAHHDAVRTFCCFSYAQRPIRRRFITSAYMTSSICSQPAVVMVTRNGREVCTDPQAHWVQAYLKHFQMPEYQPFRAAAPVQQTRPPAPDTQHSA